MSRASSGLGAADFYRCLGEEISTYFRDRPQSAMQVDTEITAIIASGVDYARQELIARLQQPRTPRQLLSDLGSEGYPSPYVKEAIWELLDEGRVELAPGYLLTLKS